MRTVECQLIDSASTFGRDPKCVSTLSWRIEHLPWRLTCIGERANRQRFTRERMAGQLIGCSSWCSGCRSSAQLKRLGAVLAVVVGEGV